MAVTSVKALLFFVGGCTAAAATAYVSDVFDPYLAGARSTVVSLQRPATPGAAPNTAIVPGQESTAAPPAGASTATPEILPSFDVVRVEADGSIIIAGKAAPNAKVEIITGSRVIGSANAGPDGDFVIVFDEPLTPGGYQFALRSITQDDVVEKSSETVVVSIPETENGQVLALVVQPGAPSKLVTVPEASSGNSGAALAPQLKAAVDSAVVEVSPATDASRVAVEAVEIEGRNVYLAGVSAPGRKVRAYLDDVLLGQADVSPDGRFLIEAKHDLSVGEHVIRVDLLAPDGVTVIARAAVAFEREPGAGIAAIAPASPAAPNTVASAPAWHDSSNGAEGNEAPAPKLQNVESAVIIRRGDTLWRISHRVYGHGARYSTIYLANETQIRDPDLIWPGQVFKVPEKTPEGETANMEAVATQATRLMQ